MNLDRVRALVAEANRLGPWELGLHGGRSRFSLHGRALRALVLDRQVSIWTEDRGGATHNFRCDSQPAGEYLADAILRTAGFLLPEDQADAAEAMAAWDALGGPRG